MYTGNIDKQRQSLAERIAKRIKDYDTMDLLKSFIEYSFVAQDDQKIPISDMLMGLCIKNNINNSKYEYDFLAYSKFIKNAKELLFSYAAESLEKAIKAKNDDLEKKIECEIENFTKLKYIYMRGDGYAEQIVRFGNTLFSNLNVEMKEVYGFTYSDVEKLFIFVFKQYYKEIDLIEDARFARIEKHNNIIADINPEELYLKYYINVLKEGVFEIHKEKLYKVIGKDIVDRILEKLGAKAGEINPNYFLPIDFNELYAKPILQIEDKIVIPLIISSIQNLPKLFHYDFVMSKLLISDKGKDKGIKEKYKKERGNHIEKLTCEYLKRIFAEKSVFMSLKYGRQFEFEADITVQFEDLIIVFECKSKLLVLNSLKGNLESIKSDFKDAIQNAYNQACRTEQHIVEGYIFKDKVGNELKLAKPNKVLKVCIVAENFGYLSTDLTYLLEVQEKGDYPIVINIYDLDIITKEAKTPAILIEYFNKRVEQNGKVHCVDELEFFESILGKNELDLERENTQYALTGYTQEIDAKYYERDKEFFLKYRI